jgi:hypothetical protein
MNLVPWEKLKKGMILINAEAESFINIIDDYSSRSGKFIIKTIDTQIRKLIVEPWSEGEWSRTKQRAITQSDYFRIIKNIFLIEKTLQ